MGRLFGLLTSVFAYLCIATVLALGIMAGWLWSSGKLNQPRLARITAIALGRDEPVTAVSATTPGAAGPVITQVSLDDVESRRSARFRQLELREQSVQNALAQVRFEQGKLTEEKDRIERVRTAFLDQLKQDRVNALVQGNENARLLLESIKPKQSKELIIKMLEADEINEVVTLFSAMPITKRAKIAAEFKTADEADHLDQILRLVRQGMPTAEQIDETQQKLVTPESAEREP